MAIQLGNSIIIRKLLQARTHHLKNAEKYSNLQLSVLQNSLIHCKIVANFCSFIFEASGWGKPAMHLAVKLGNHEIISFLLLHDDMVPNLQDENGDTILHDATNAVTTKMLLDHCQGRLNINIPNFVGNTALHCAALWYVHLNDE